MYCTWPTDEAPILSPRSSAQLFQVVYAESFSGGENIIVLAERGTEIDKLVRIIFDTRLAEYSAGEYARRAGADRQSFGLCSVYVIGGLSASSSRHIFRKDSWIPRNVLLQKRQDRFSS